VGGCTRLDAGFFILWKCVVDSEKWVGEVEEPSCGHDSSNTEAKAELEGKIAERGRVRPSRRALRQLGHSDKLGIKRSLTTERLASPRR